MTSTRHDGLDISRQEDVDRAMARVSWLGRPIVSYVRVTLPWLDREERDKAERVLQRLFNDCGCHLGGPVFLVTLLLALGVAGSGKELSWTFVAIYGPAAVGLAVGAKFLALAWSRWRLFV